ncbi:MAG: hypothetical protein WAM42_24710 [Candidatus Nitrosopolaris sp.]
MQSRDGGRIWIDRVEQGPYDTHTLSTHQKAPKRLYSSAGDGYFESFDYGESWKRHTTGLKHHYLAGLAVDPAEPNTILVSASQSALQAHSIEHANSLVYRRSVEDECGEWKAIFNGLPESGGTIITILAANPKNKGEFYAINMVQRISFTTSLRTSNSRTGLVVPYSALINKKKKFVIRHLWRYACSRSTH